MWLNGTEMSMNALPLKDIVKNQTKNDSVLEIIRNVDTPKNISKAQTSKIWKIGHEFYISMEPTPLEWNTSKYPKPSTNWAVSIRLHTRLEYTTPQPIYPYS